MLNDAGMGVATNPIESEETEPGDPISPAAFGLPMLEKLILALIDGQNLGSDPSRRTRLNTAIKAIAGRGASRAALPQNPNREARDAEAKEASVLLWMARRYIAAPPGEKPSNRDLADNAAAEFYPSGDPQILWARAEDLRKKFAGSYDKRRKDWKPDAAVDVRGSLLFQSSEHDYVTESVEAQILQRIRDELALAGVKMTLPD